MKAVIAAFKQKKGPSLLWLYIFEFREGSFEAVVWSSDYTGWGDVNNENTPDNGPRGTNYNLSKSFGKKKMIFTFC